MQEYSLYEQGGGICSRPIVMQNANTMQPHVWWAMWLLSPSCKLVMKVLSQLQHQLTEREIAG